MSFAKIFFAFAFVLSTFGCQQSTNDGQADDPIASSFSGVPTHQLNGYWYGLGEIRHNKTVQQNLKYEIKIDGLPKNLKIDLQIFDQSTNTSVTTFRYFYGTIVGNLIYDSRTNEKVGYIGAQGLRLLKNNIGYLQIQLIVGDINKSHVSAKGIFGGDMTFIFDSDIERK